MTKYTTRLIVEMNTDGNVHQQFSRIAAQKKMNVSDVIKAALATYMRLIEETNSPELKVSITNEHDRVLRDIQLP